MSEIARYRDKNLPTLQDWGLVGLPVGLAVSAAMFQWWWLTGLAAIGAVALFWRMCNTHSMITMSLDEFRSEDYSLAYKLSLYAPILFFPLTVLGVAVEDFLPFAEADLDLVLPESLQKLGAGAVYATGAALTGWGSYRLYQRAGTRRLRSVAANPSLDGVTETRIDLVEEHHAIVNGLAAIGAVDGLRVPHGGLCKLIGVEPETNRPALEELLAAGIVDAERIGMYADLEAWHLTLTEAGVRCMLASSQR